MDKEKSESPEDQQTSYSTLIQVMQKKLPLAKVTEVHDPQDGTVKLTFFLKPQPSSKAIPNCGKMPIIPREPFLKETRHPVRTKPEPTMEEDPQYWRDLFKALM